jgi:hypothetical protein
MTANPAVPPASTPRSPVEHDLQTALSLARASTTALLNLSALGRREIVTALNDELARLRSADDESSRHAAGVLTRYLRGAGS